MKILYRIILVNIIIIISACSQHPGSASDDLFAGFATPPADSRPFVRWWWNGNCIEGDEIKRELDILKAAGIGGVEINPIAMPEEVVDVSTRPVEWLSKGWNELLVLAVKEAKQRGMITDLIVGSGWPFGGEFLREDETIQRVITNKIGYPDGSRIRESNESLVEKAVKAQSRPSEKEVVNSKLLFVSLVPVNIKNVSETIDLTNEFRKNNRLDYAVKGGNYELVYGILQHGHREVMHGAPGAAGPVMDHYKREVTLAYLGRLKKISEDTGIPLSELIRALFCDSIELAGANWTDGFSDIFNEMYHYRIEDYYPFIFYDSYEGYSNDEFTPEFQDEIKRVRYDYNQLLVKVFLDNFTRTFQQFCRENGLKCRYQAYGTPFLMGMTEGNMIIDIPESNNWIYTVDMDADEWNWNQGHGYMIWNLYAASGGHLTGRKIISCEAMTNTKGVFKTSLEEIKRHDDMNFITGINHTILHGYNYSPTSAGFPGWIRYGTYFSEHNTWWPWFSKWTDYNARLSYLFQNSQPVKSVAILTPEGDIWSVNGLTRFPFHTRPWYFHRLWEPLSQAGSSCDYINEKIIQQGNKNGGTLSYGPMSYKAIILSNIHALEPETALSLLEFVRTGGKLVLVENIPSKSHSLQDAVSNDIIVEKAFSDIMKYTDRCFGVNSPVSETDLLSWTEKLLQNISIGRDVEISNPNKNIFQIRKKSGDKDIFFFVNSHRKDYATFTAVFPTGKKTAWMWNPEDGTRKVYPNDKSKNELTIDIQPLQSLLLVFEPDLKGKADDLQLFRNENRKVMTVVEGPWKVNFDHVSGKTFQREFDSLYDFGTTDDQQLNSFAGTVTYTTTFNSDGTGTLLELGEVSRGITEVYLNGISLGVNWYGKPRFLLKDRLLIGENRLEIRYTTVLANYCKSLVENPTAAKWTRQYTNISMGLEGAVVIF